jgi:uncharacterized metal-binding protein YceD (DUF177 family)
MYEFIAVAIPIKKLHPRFRDEDGGDEAGKIVYRASTEGDSSVDPRWDALKKLK